MHARENAKSTTPVRRKPAPPNPHAKPGAHELGELGRKLSKDEINALPMVAYTGPLHVVTSPEQAQAAARALRREKLLGFDTETRPAFRKGEHYPPALLQLAGAHAVWVFQLAKSGFPEALAAVLADPDIIKAGVSNARDVAELRRLRDFKLAGFVDIGLAARKIGMQHHGLRGLAAVALGGRISKSAQLTNWSRPDLSPRALQYAATDAWIGRRLYEVLPLHAPPAVAAAASAPARRPPKKGKLGEGVRSLLQRAMVRWRR